MKKKLAVWALFGLAFVVNPALFACSSEGENEDFTYAESDLKAHVLGEWQGVAEVDGESFAFTLHLEQASSKSSTQSISAPAFQPQCGSRSFVKPAAACISMSTMPLLGTINADDSPELTATIVGEAEAFRNLDPTNLRVELESGRVLRGTLTEGAITDGELFEGESGSAIGSFTLSRP